MSNPVAGSAALRNVGTIAGTVAAGDDSRFGASHDFQPYQIPGLSLWLRGSNLAGLADGTAVATWPDRSGNGNDATQSSSGARPTKITGYDGRSSVQFNGGQRLDLPASLSIVPRSASVYFVIRERATGGSPIGGYLFDLGTAGNQNLLANNQYAMYISDGGPGADTGAPGMYYPQCSYGVVGYRASSASTIFHVNDSLRGSVSVLGSTALTGGTIGQSSGAHSFIFSGEIAEVLIYNRGLNESEQNALMGYFALPPFRMQIACVGDSLTFGFRDATSTASPIQGSYPFLLNRLLGDQAKTINAGVPGWTTSDISSHLAADVIPYIDASYYPGANFVCVWIGTNDLTNNADPTTTYNNLAAICASCRSAGALVIAADCISRVDMNSTQEAHRQTFNGLCRTNAGTFCDRFVDLDANTILGGVGAYSNLNLYEPDQIHLTRQGYEVVARAFAKAIKAL